MMRKSGSWMTIWDDRILEYILQEGSGSASEMKDEEYFQISRSQISRRLKKLSQHGMLQHLGNGVYIITETGKGYLEGDINAEDLNGEGGEGNRANA